MQQQQLKEIDYTDFFAAKRRSRRKRRLVKRLDNQKDPCRLRELEEQKGGVRGRRKMLQIFMWRRN